MKREPKCTLYRTPCPAHEFTHGGEAEQLRSGIESMLANGNDYVPAWALRKLLDRVDARDSLAWLEARP